MQTDQLEVIKIITKTVLFQKFTHITEHILDMYLQSKA